MTKKDYIAFAEIFKYSREALARAEEERREISAEGMLKAIERDVADVFQADNSRFDYVKFMKYIQH